MYTTPLFLSHWDTSTPVCVSLDCVKDLKNYNIMGVRFLYSCFHKQQQGSILNHEDGMNFEIQVSAFLNAFHDVISSENPVLIICPQETIRNWHYHLVNHGGYDVIVLSLLNVDDFLQSTIPIILSIVDNTAALKKIKQKNFFCIVVDHLDTLVSKSIVKQIKAQFNIGLTNRNFIKHPDQKLFWTMLNWSNPGVIGKFPDFSDEDNEHLNNLRNPYSEWWQRLTWKFCDSFIPPSDNDIKEYRLKLKEWSRNHNTFGTSLPNAKTRKRKPSKSDTDGSEVKIPKLTRKRQAHSDVPVNDTSLLKKEVMETDIQINPLKNVSHESNFDNSFSSTDTVIYDFKNSPIDDSDENYILSSIISGKSVSTRSIKSDETKTSWMSNKEDINDDDDNIVRSIVESESSKPTTSQRNELLSLLYGND